MTKGFDKYNLSTEISKALNELGYATPTKVQEKVIPEALLNKDLIVKSQTGTGKTASFVIPLCERVDWNESSPQVLILSPTRELAIQIGEDVKNIGRYKRIKGVAVYGKAPFKDQARELKSKCHIVIGTPGRVLDHIDRETLDVSKNTSLDNLYCDYNPLKTLYVASGHKFGHLSIPEDAMIANK